MEHNCRSRHGQSYVSARRRISLAVATTMLSGSSLPLAASSLPCAPQPPDTLEFNVDAVGMAEAHLFVPIERVPFESEFHLMESGSRILMIQRTAIGHHKTLQRD